jgi:hypothetical protein
MRHDKTFFSHLHKPKLPDVYLIKSFKTTQTEETSIMKSFRAKAFTLVALTIAVAAANIAPSFAEDLPNLGPIKISPGDIPTTVTPGISSPVAHSGSISVSNRGVYVARYKLSYNLNLNTKTFDSGDITVGKKIAFSIPPGATNIQIVGELYTGIFNKKKIFFSQRFDRLNSPIYLTTFGTVINPQMSLTQ